MTRPTTAAPAHTPSSIARGVLALLAVLAMCLGVPTLLLRLGARPHSLNPSALWDVLTSRDDGTLLAAILTAAVWICWALFTWDVLRETLTAVRRHTSIGPIPSPRRRGGFTPVTAPMVHAILALFLTGPAVLHATPAVAATTTSTAQPAAPPAATAAPEPGHPTPHTTPQADPNTGPDAGDAPATITVRRYDTLWRLAERHLGDPERWPELRNANRDQLGDSTLIHEGDTLRLPPASSHTHRDTRQPTTVTVHRGDTLSEIADDLGRDSWAPTYRANQGRPQPDGGRLTDPDLIRPGWRLTVPADPDTQPAPPVHTNTPPPRPTPRPAPPQAHTPQTPRPDGTTDPTGTPTAPTGTATARPPATNNADATPGQTPAQTPLTSPAETTPTATAPAETPADPVSEPEATQPADNTTHPLVVIGGLGGFTAAIAGVSMLVLRRRRQTSARRARRPGRTLPPPTPEAIAGARALATVDPLIPTVQLLDTELRRLGRWCVDAAHPLPPLAAVHLTQTSITAHLTAPADFPRPWIPTSDQTGWTLNAADAQPADADVEQAPAPYPLLFAVGADTTGTQWLLNAESVTALNVTGDLDQARDFVRQVTAGLASNPWSEDVNIACAGQSVGEAAARIAPERVLLFPDPDAAAAAVLTDATELARRSQHHCVAVPNGRTSQAGDELWPAYALIIDDQPPSPAVDQLVDFLTTHPEQTGTTILVTAPGDHAPDGAIELAITHDGDISIPAVGLTLTAATLTREQAHACAAALEQPPTTTDSDPNPDDLDAPMPPPEHTAAPWQELTDVAGALRVEYTTPRATSPTTLPDPDVAAATAGPDTTAPDTSASDTTATSGSATAIETAETAEQTGGLLPHTETAYHDAAITPDDLETLDPHVPQEHATRVLQADPDLDADLAAWNSPDCPLPKLQVLGPLRAHTRGDPKVVANRKPYYTGLLAYLAAHPNGVTTEQIADVFNVKPSSARSYMRTLRLWLGDNPRTGQRHIPEASQSPAGQAHGTSLYQVVDLLCDADLLRRLRVRAQARRGPEGINDLITALQLVKGRPYEDPGRQGLTWLLEGDRLDHHLLCAIVDIAHIITTQALSRGDHTTARWAAETSLAAGPDEEIALLDLAAVTRAEGHHQLAAQLIHEHLTNRHDNPRQPPPQLPPRTQTILKTRPDWTQPDTAQAS